METYLLNDDVDYKILLFYILKNLNTDIKREIYNKLLTYEIIEITTQGWAELVIQDDFYDNNFYIDLYDDLELFRDE